MSIQVNGSSVDATKMWETLLSSVGEVKKTTTAEGKAALTVTVGEGESARTVTMIPDDLELPATADSAALDSLVAKLKGIGLEMTPEEIAVFKETATQVYKEAAKALAEVKSKSSGNTMFDLYALMKLMVEVAQKQRDAQREMRNTENKLVQKAIQNQADQQRDAAWLGLVLGVACGLLSAGLSLGMMFSQSSAASRQTKLANNAGLDASNTKVDMLKMSDTTVHADQQLATIQGKVGNETANRVTTEFEAKVNQGEAGNLHTKYTDAKAAVEAKEAELATANEQLTAANNDVEQAQATKAQAEQALNTAKEQAGYAAAEQAHSDAVNAKAAYERDVPENQRDPQRLQEFDNDIAAKESTLNQKKAAIADEQQAFDTASRELDTKLATANNKAQAVQTKMAELDTAKTNLAKAKNDYVETLKSVGDEYADKYQVALDRKNNPPEGVDKATLAADLKKAKDEMLMARALEAKKLSEPGLLDPADHKLLVNGAKAENDIALRRLNESEDYKQAGLRIQRLMGFNGIIMSIGGTLQSMTQNLSALQQSEATRQGAEQQRENEMLDQTKDLFAQDQKVIDAVIQLMQAVLQAETTSIRDAIQA